MDKIRNQFTMTIIITIIIRTVFDSIKNNVTYCLYTVCILLVHDMNDLKQFAMTADENIFGRNTSHIMYEYQNNNVYTKSKIFNRVV